MLATSANLEANALTENRAVAPKYDKSKVYINLMLHILASDCSCNMLRVLFVRFYLSQKFVEMYQSKLGHSARRFETICRWNHVGVRQWYVC